MNILSGKLFITIFIYLYIILPLINSQVKQSSPQPSEENKKFQESVDKFEQINLLYKNITEKMIDIKYNILLKIKYRFLVSKHESILNKINNINTTLKNQNKTEEYILNDIYNLNEYIHSYRKACHKMVSLYQSFENLKSTIINLIKIFFLILGILIIIVLIISGIILYYYYKKRRSYTILNEEVSQTNFSNFVDAKNSELERIKVKNDNIDKKEKRKEKKHKKKEKKNIEKTEKSDNIEVLDDK